MSSSLEGVRALRRWQTAAAVRLSALAGGRTELLDAVNFSALRGLPHWCFIEESERDALQRIAGCLYLLPALQRTLDGDVFQTVRTLVGKAVTDRLMAMDAPVVHGGRELDIDPPLPDRVRAAGAAVLLSTLSDRTIMPLFFGLFDRPAGALPIDVAQRLYRTACRIREDSGADAGTTGSSTESGPESDAEPGVSDDPKVRVA